MKSVYKYLVVSVLITILAITLFGFYSLNKFHTTEENNEYVKLEMCIRTFWQLLSFYGDDYKIVDRKLIVGSYVTNDHFELPDRIQEIFGGVATIFMGDERVSTNVLNDRGERALGTRLEGPAYDAVFKSGKSYRGATMILGVSYLTAYDPITDKAGNVIGALFVGVKETDFTDRLHVMKKEISITLLATVSVLAFFLILMGRFIKRAEADAKSAYQQLHDIVEFLPDATFVVDREKRVIAWNRAIEQMTGLKKEEVIGKGDFIYSVPFYGDRRPILIDLIDEDIEVIKKNYTYINIVGRTLFAETHLPSFKNGTGCYLSGTATPLFDSRGNQVGGIESIRDITEYKLTVDEKNRLESQLDHTRLMETVMSRLGHDLKTPLTPLFVMLPLIRKRLTEPDLIKKIDMCISCAATINNLANKTRMLAHLSRNVKPDEFQVVPLATIVDQALSECSGIINKKQIHCHNNVDLSITVRCVPAQFHELFLNIITNAVQFSGEKSVITITAEQRNDTLLFSINDNGVGIDPAHLDHIFDEFYKVDDSRHDLDTSGLGLSICKRIVKNHHGRIWAESPGLGSGTTLKISLKQRVD